MSKQPASLASRKQSATILHFKLPPDHQRFGIRYSLIAHLFLWFGGEVDSGEIDLDGTASNDKIRLYCYVVQAICEMPNEDIDELWEFIDALEWDDRIAQILQYVKDYIVDEWSELMTQKQPASLASRMMREVRKAQAMAHSANLRKLRAQEITGPVQDSGTGQTILKLRRHQPPLGTLVEAKKIGAVELQAATEIELAAMSVRLGGRLAAIGIERVDHGRQNDSPWPMEVALAVRNYQSWQNHWTREHAITGNPMLEVIWAAVVDERPISVISQEIGYGRHLTARAIVCGLRHYAAWSHMITGTQAAIWTGEAQHLFDRRLLATTN